LRACGRPSAATLGARARATADGIPPPGQIHKDTENLGEASADHIGHYLDNPNFVHYHGEIESSLEHKGNRPTER